MSKLTVCEKKDDAEPQNFEQGEVVESLRTGRIFLVTAPGDPWVILWPSSKDLGSCVNSVGDFLRVMPGPKYHFFKRTACLKLTDE